MLGAVFGDIIGSTYEWENRKSEQFDLFPPGSRFTDDTVLSAAVADALLSAPDKLSDGRMALLYAEKIRQYYARYPDAGFGEGFRAWAARPALSRQDSYANGAAMRVTPVAYAFSSLEDVLRQAKISCLYTHRHPEAVAGAQAVAGAVYLARTGRSKTEIRAFAEREFAYDLSFTLDAIRPRYTFDCRASYSVPPAIAAFLESDSYESAVRKAVSIGGDSDTIACMAGGIAHAFYGEIPRPIAAKAWSLLDGELQRVLRAFCEKYGVRMDF